MNKDPKDKFKIVIVAKDSNKAIEERSLLESQLALERWLDRLEEKVIAYFKRRKERRERDGR